MKNECKFLPGKVSRRYWLSLMCLPSIRTGKSQSAKRCLGTEAYCIRMESPCSPTWFVGSLVVEAIFVTAAFQLSRDD